MPSSSPSPHGFEVAVGLPMRDPVTAAAAGVAAQFQVAAMVGLPVQDPSRAGDTLLAFPAALLTSSDWGPRSALLPKMYNEQQHLSAAASPSVTPPRFRAHHGGGGAAPLGPSWCGPAAMLSSGRRRGGGPQHLRCVHILHSVFCRLEDTSTSPDAPPSAAPGSAIGDA